MKLGVFGYKSDRSESAFVQNRLLFDYIEKVGASLGFTLLSFFYEKLYGIPVSVSSMKAKRIMRLSFENKKGGFNRELSFFYFFMGFVKHVGLLFYVLLFSKKKSGSISKSLIIDDIAGDQELAVFERLIKLYGPSKIIIVSKGCVSNSYGCELLILERFKGYERTLAVKSLLKDLFVGVPVFCVLSLLTRSNMFYFASRITNNFLYYSSMFEFVTGDYLLQMRHIGMTPLRRYLFNKYGGKAACCLQKSILQADQTSFYYDVDTFFSLGQSTVKRADDYGARIGSIIPVGSVFGESQMPDDFREILSEIDYKYDLVYLGINVMNGRERFDSYANFNDDYYSATKWLVKLKVEFTDLKIAFIHHASAGIDPIEDEILSEVDIEVVDSNVNSYDIALKSKLCVTYASTMGYELNAIGKPCLFLDPNYRNSFLEEYSKNDIYREFRVECYNSFKARVLTILEDRGAIIGGWSSPDELCMDPKTVSHKIVAELS